MAPAGPQLDATHTPAAPALNNQQPDIRVRSYRPQDLKAVRELFVDGMMYYCGKDTPESQGLPHYIERSLGLDMADIEGTYFASGGHFWVATITDAQGEEQIAGMVAYEGKEDGKGELRRMSVKTEYRRYGLARRLVDHLERWAKAQGFHAVTLNTGCQMLPALKMYDALGYTRTHVKVLREDPYFALIFFEKPLI